MNFGVEREPEDKSNPSFSLNSIKITSCQNVEKIDELPLSKSSTTHL